MKRFFVNSRGLAVFRTVVKAVNASPHCPVPVMGSPTASSTGCTTFAANKKLGQGVFTAVLALFGRILGACGTLGIAPRDLLLYTVEGIPVNDCGVAVADIVHRSFAFILG